MVKISPALLGLSLLPLLVVSWAVRHFGRRIHDRFEQVQAELANMNTVVQESLAGIRVVRAYVQGGAGDRALRAHERRLSRAEPEADCPVREPLPGHSIPDGPRVAAVLWLGGRLVIGASISLGQFVAFNSYLAMLQWPMIAVGWVVNIFERGEASMGRIGEILDAPVAIADRAPADVPPLRGAVEFRGLDFGYGGRTVLHDVRLKFPRGRWWRSSAPPVPGRRRS